MRLSEKPRRGLSGFTLVELLVVIGIIAVLIGILLPVISRARKQANTTACMAAMRNLGQAMMGYAVDNKGSLPWGYYESQASVGAANTEAGDEGEVTQYTWWSVIRAWMRGRGANPDNSMTNNDGTKQTRMMPAFACPEGNNRDAGCDFGVNMAMMPDYRYETQFERHAVNWPLLKPARLQWLYPDNIIMWDATELAFTDPPFARQYVVGYDVDGALLSQPKRNPSWRYRDLVGRYATDPVLGDSFPINPGLNRDIRSSGETGSKGNIRWRHGKNNQANFLFADGTVRPLNMTVGFGTSGVRGDVQRRMLRMKWPPGITGKAG